MKDPAIGNEVHAALMADPKGVGAWIVYTCDRIQNEGAAVAPKQKPGAAAKPTAVAKPTKVAAEAKNDL